MISQYCKVCKYRLDASEIRAGRTTCRIHDQPTDSKVADKDPSDPLGRPSLGPTKRTDSHGERC